MKQLIKHLLDPKLSLLYALAYTLFIFVFSLINLKDVPTPKFDNSDKVMHLVAYFGIMILWSLYYFSKKDWKKVQMKSLTIICLLIIAFGIFIEVLQGTLTNYRSMDSLDVLANSIGVFSGFLLILSMRKRLEKVKSIL
ncbi:VanZ family protein [Mesonia aestuariivivens]|uniref:VanZ family protein n=1 Tax=Mesonia aestuariivivens TaxID=2796128 RepID=A0ABS6W5Q0_9FLAO|nr:VanZ family protein [Mesonia aestuariivivens]MBW2962444.1 VanZ family protein [Mesonia aestuariivivens]